RSSGQTAALIASAMVSDRRRPASPVVIARRFLCPASTSPRRNPKRPEARVILGRAALEGALPPEGRRRIMVGESLVARTSQSLPQNVPGEFFVDDSCIDCDACRQIAPETFVERGAHSIVQRQPATDDEVRRALMALVACPTASIGTRSRR